MIITPFAGNLPALLSARYSSQPPLHLLGQGHRERLPELMLTGLTPEAHQTNRERTTRLGIFGASVVASHSRWPQRVGPAVEVL